MAAKLRNDGQKPRGFSSPQQAAVVGLLRTNDLFQYRFGQLFREYGLTQPQYNVLRVLRAEGGPLPCLEIAARMITVVPAITSLIDKLETRGLVTRERCTADRRVWYVALAAAGTKLLKQMDAPVMAMHEMLCKGLSVSECQQLIRLLEKAREPHDESSEFDRV
jgi:DNA-binding MarR family transcriptional regulator